MWCKHNNFQIFNKKFNTHSFETGTLESRSSALNITNKVCSFFSAGIVDIDIAMLVIYRQFKEMDLQQLLLKN